MFTLTSAHRLIVTKDTPLQHYEVLHLTREGFTLEKGVWVKHHSFEPKVAEIVFEISGAVPCG